LLPKAVASAIFDDVKTVLPSYHTGLQLSVKSFGFNPVCVKVGCVKQ
jgi:hypothetical protein